MINVCIEGLGGSVEVCIKDDDSAHVTVQPDRADAATVILDPAGLELLRQAVKSRELT